MNEPIIPWPLDSESRKKHIAKGSISAAKYEFRFMFDYCAETCLWSDNEAAIEKYGIGSVDLDEFPLSTELKAELISLCDKHDTALDWKNPQNGIIWTSEEQYAFMGQARIACFKVIHELGPNFGISFNRNHII